MTATAERNTRMRGWYTGMVLVALNPVKEFHDTLELAVALAQRDARRLALLGLVPQPALWMSCAPAPLVSRQSMCDDIRNEATQACASLIDDVPNDVPVTFAVMCGRPSTLLTRLMAADPAECLVLPKQWAESRQIRRQARQWDRAGICLHSA
jgi:hypothetical protein